MLAPKRSSPGPAASVPGTPGTEAAGPGELRLGASIRHGRPVQPRRRAGVSVRKIDFQGGGTFYAELKDGVRQYLADRPRVRRAQRRMYVKSAVILAWAVGSWALLVFWADSLWVGGLLAI